MRNVSKRVFPCIFTFFGFLGGMGCDNGTNSNSSKPINSEPAVSSSPIPLSQSKNNSYVSGQSPTTSIDVDDSVTIRDLNGETKECDVYSSKSSGTYTLEVDFEGDQAKINFPSGGYKYLDIDNPDDTDFSSISATDNDGESWEISVNDPPESKVSPLDNDNEDP